MSINLWTEAQVIGQLAPSGARWAGDVITFAFPLTASGMVGTAEELLGFSPLDAATQAKFRIAIQSWDDLITPGFLETSGPSDIEAGYTTHGVEYAAYGASLWLNPSFASPGDDQLVNAPIGNSGYRTYVHELGHALGLFHMGAYNSAADAVPSSYQDSSPYSVMSYFGHHAAAGMPVNVMQAEWNDSMGRHAFAQTPMLSDIEAIQALYGASATTRTGNTTYGFNCSITGPMAAIYDFAINGSPVLTLFDSGGDDTLDLSGWTTASAISLVSGSFSSCASMVNNIAIAYSCVIENAIGGSGNDVIGGNRVANLLQGGAGNDSFLGAEGNDTLAGGSGNDTLNGGEGTDVAVFSGSHASYSVSHNVSQGTYTVAGPGSSLDIVGDIEFLQFDDELFELDPGAGLSATEVAPGAPLPDGGWTVDAPPATDGLLGIDTAALSGSIVQAGERELLQVQLIEGVQYRFELTGSGAVLPELVLYDAAATALAVGEGAPASILDFSASASGTYYLGVSGGSTAVGNYELAASIPDTQAPQLLAWSTPYDPAWANPNQQGNLLMLRFNEPVLPGTGNIVIHNGDGSVATSIGIETPQVDVSGHVISIHPDTLLAYGSDYYITFDDGVIADEAGNVFERGNGHPDLGFSIAIEPDDYGMARASARLVMVDNWDLESGRIEREGDQDMFRVDVAAGHIWQAEVHTFGGASDLYVQVYDANMALVGEQHMPDGETSAYVYDPGMSEGPYYVTVGSAGSGTGPGYYFVGAFQGADDAPWDPQDAPSLGLGQNLGGSVDMVGDADLFKMQLVAGTEYAVSMTTTNGGPSDSHLGLHDSEMAELSETTLGPGNDGILYLRPETSGSFFLGVLGAWEGWGTSVYQLHLGTTLGASANVLGTNAAEMLTGHDSNDYISGLGGNDTLDRGERGNDTLDGGAGIDLAIMHFASTDIASASFDGLGHLHVGASTGATTFIDVERVRLADGLVAFDTQEGGSLWQAAALLRAALGTAPDMPLLSQWVSVADTSVSMAGLGQQMLDFYAPGLATETLVRLLFDKTLHSTPTDGDVNFVASLVGHGQVFETNGDLFAYVASLPANADSAFTGSTFQWLDPSYFL